MGNDELEQKLRRAFGKVLRQVYGRSPLKSAVYARDELPGGGWRCYLCLGQSDYKRDFQVEHLSPVVPPERGYLPAMEYFMRMFCFRPDGTIDLANLAVCCKECHAVKTAEETAIRARLGTGQFSPAAKAKALETRRKRHARKSKRRR